MTTTMSPIDQYSDLFTRLAEQRTSDPKWLSGFRQAGLATFQKLGFPTQDLEEWRFTSVRPVAETAFSPAEPRHSVQASDIEPFLHAELTGPRLVFVNGRFDDGLSNVTDLPSGMTLGNLRTVISSDERFVSERLGKLTNNESAHFTALNNALFEDGLVLFVPSGTKVDQPIQVLFVTASEADPILTNPRNIFVFGAGSEAHIVETHVSLSENVYLTNAVTEVWMGERARADHYRIQRESESAFHFSTLRLYEESNSHFRSHNVDFGGAIVRNDSWGKLDGDNCEATINGLYVLRGRQHIDNHMWMEHVKENIPSHELYKGVLDDHSSAVFAGRIYVHPEAQKTDAKQTNQTLLLSDDARLNSMPQLEIYADDVKCTHGATVGQIDPVALFYLMSRAIDKETARNVLIHAFAADITERIRIDAVRKNIERTLRDRLLT